MKVKVLSLKQPWAELIVNGKKSIELRKWNTKLRGEFYIHASMNTNVEKCRELGINPDNLIKGAIIGKAELSSIRNYETKQELLKDKDYHFASDYELPCYGFVLKNAKRINPIRHKGALGFWSAEI
ncbi:MAG: ASCH domain-containing protein [Candidatus Nanoarchaeia archaeon]|jgi:ASC-1-like (ASCH) protein